MEILIRLPAERPGLKALLFDFDGTISTLRYGWEKIMEPLMLEMISSGRPYGEDLVREVREYISQSTGIQTIFQMKWLVNTIKKYGFKAPSDDPWFYKNEYNRRLMSIVEERKNKILDKKALPENFMIKGSKKLLEAIRASGLEIYVASGTDHPDVVEEVSVLGLGGYFTEIAGAPPGREDCSKEAILRKLIYERGLKGPEVAVVGDGKVEISLGREVGALTLGVASNESTLEGINPVKRERLIKAGAHAVVGDFSNTENILGWLGIASRHK